MKRTSIVLMVVALAVSFAVVVDAEAGLFGKKNKDKEEKYLPRYDKSPSLEFHQGILHRNTRTGWRLGDLDIQFLSDCKILADGVEDAELREGRPAIVTGPRWGNTIVAWRVRVMKWDQNYDNTDPNMNLQESDVTPLVSVGTSPQ